MKATELMIGDWVQIKGHLDYDKVREIAMDENMEWYISFACSATLFRAYEFVPIPLSPEILEKNGWEIYYEVGAIYLAIRKDWNLTIVVKKIGGLPYLRIAHNWICNIRHVHELQHALRLCGFNDLADDFKV